MWIDILLHHITSDSPRYDLITWVTMFVPDNQLGLICVFVLKLTIRSIKYRAHKTMSYNYTNVTEHITAPTVKSVPIICFTSF